MTTELKRKWIAKETIHVGQSDDLKVEDGSTRIWVSRVENGKDGLPIVTVERLKHGRWAIFDQS